MLKMRRSTRGDRVCVSLRDVYLEGSCADPNEFGRQATQEGQKLQGWPWKVVMSCQ